MSTSSALHDRLTKAVGERSYREIGSLSKTHPETVRRYMQGQAPSVEFLASLARGLELNGSWLLTGVGPVRQSEIRDHALRDADVSELLNAMAETIEDMGDRIERLELFVQTLETRLHAARGLKFSATANQSHANEASVQGGGEDGAVSNDDNTSAKTTGTTLIESGADDRNPDDGSSPEVVIRGQNRGSGHDIAGAISERPPGASDPTP